MARNKYPEVTVEKILDAAQRLFLEKGYDNTTIQDIVDELGGLTKGAIYHHFKSKEDIINALGDKLYFENNPFLIVGKRKELNALQKLQEIIKFQFKDKSRTEINRQSIPILKNPRILAQMIESNRTLVVPRLEALIEEGNHDGSMHTEYPKELAQALQLLSTLWLATPIYPGTKEEIIKRLDFIKAMTDNFGVPIFTDDIMATCKEFVLYIGSVESE